MMPRRIPTRSRRGVRGSQMIEFALMGIPFVFLIIAIVQMSIGMFTYNTLASAVDLGTRYASAHPTGTVDAVAQQIINNSPGLLSNKLNLVMKGTTGGAAGNPGALATVASGFASTLCPTPNNTGGPLCGGAGADGTAYPAATAVAFSDTVTITATYKFLTPLALFWPGQRTMLATGTVTLGATTTQLIE